MMRKEVGGIASNVQGRATGKEKNRATACEGSIWVAEREDVITES